VARVTGSRVVTRGGPETPDPATQLERLILALVPLRLFLGVTFVYAGIDKIIDPAFLRATGSASTPRPAESPSPVEPTA
jgi:hypothetical protein